MTFKEAIATHDIATLRLFFDTRNAARAANKEKDDVTDAWRYAFEREFCGVWVTKQDGPIVGFGACTDHNFIDTGMKKSWCKKCDKEGIFNSSKGIYE